MPRPWRYCPHDETLVRRISHEAHVSPLLAQVLVARGINVGADAVEFLQARLTDLHDPSLLPGVDEAADRIVAAFQADRRITIYGDYDVDGVTATSLLWHCLKLAGAKVDYYIPCRIEEGYGINCDAIRQLHEEDPQRVVVSVDCGITSVAEARLAGELGLELIITDHHHLTDEIPPAASVVHPRLPGSQYPFGDLCGVGVAFKLAWAICQRLGDGRKASPKMREFLKSAVGLAAIGTVADVVPLLAENRVIVRYGLQSLVDRPSLGLKTLMTTAELHDKRVLRSDDIAFSLAPRINAAGRLGQARLAVELLTTDNPERAIALADYLNQLNKNRQTVERRILKQAKEIVTEHDDWQNAAALVLAHEDWHPGVIGIVASRVAEHFQRPTVLLTLKSDEMGQGSGRTWAGFDLYGGVSACAEHLVTFGGHQAAVGLRIERGRIDDFRAAFANYVMTHHRPAASDGELRVDAEVRLADVTRQAVLELDRLGPFGMANERPVFATRVELAEPPKKMGEGERHLSLRVKQFGTSMRAVAFGKGEWADEMAAERGSIVITFAPTINSFRGIERVELHLIDWHPADAAAVQSGNSTADRRSASA